MAILIKILPDNTFHHTKEGHDFSAQNRKKHARTGKISIRHTGSEYVRSFYQKKAIPMGNIVQDHTDELKNLHFRETKSPSASPFFHGLRMEMDENMGQGWSEILRVHNGVYVEMLDYQAKQKATISHQDKTIPLKFTLLLSGRFDSKLPGQKVKKILAGDIWCIHGQFEQIVLTQFPDEKICGVSICLPQDFIESWLKTSCCRASSNLEKLAFGSSEATLPEQQAVLLKRGLHHSSTFIRIARELIQTTPQTISDYLRFESQTLDLLSQILTLEDPVTGYLRERNQKTRVAVDDAADILRQEWDRPPNISTLARRVGVNESYLKEWFREHTGQTIGEFIREQRMKKALELIETGRYSILQTALFVGYSNPSHFSAAFKKFYGQLPSYYLPRSGKTSCTY